MEIRFFAPGNLVSNLDFVESIFGNGGNPYLADFDAALDVDHWSGHTGCVLLAPHLTTLTKQELGLPHWDHATARQRADGMCWQDPDGALQRRRGLQAHRPRRLRGHLHHPGGQLLRLLQEGGEDPDQLCRQSVRPGRGGARRRGAGLPAGQPRRGVRRGQHAPASRATLFADMVERYGEIMDLQPEGYGIDKRFPQVIYVPQALRMELNAQRITWEKDGDDPVHPPAAGQDLHPAQRLQGRDAQAPGRPVLASHRHPPRGDLLPQALHRLGRRQVRDLQVPRRRRPLRPDLRRRPAQGPGPGAGDLRPRLHRPLPPRLRARGPRSRAQAVVPGAQPGLGDQAADPVAQLQAGVQRLARVDPATAAGRWPS